MDRLVSSPSPASPSVHVTWFSTEGLVVSGDTQHPAKPCWDLVASRRRSWKELLHTDSKDYFFPTSSSLTFQWCWTNRLYIENSTESFFFSYQFPFLRRKFISTPLLLKRIKKRASPLKLSFQPTWEKPHNLDKEFHTPPSSLSLASPSLLFVPFLWCSSEVNQNFPSSKMQCKHM